MVKAASPYNSIFLRRDLYFAQRIILGAFFRFRTFFLVFFQEQQKIVWTVDWNVRVALA